MTLTLGGRLRLTWVTVEEHNGIHPSSHDHGSVATLTVGTIVAIVMRMFFSKCKQGVA